MMLAIWGLFLLVLSHVAKAEEEVFAIKESRSLDQLKEAERNGELEKSGPQYLDFLRASGRYEEFAKLMRIKEVNLVMPTSERMLEDPILSKVSPLGDILLNPEQAEQDRQGVDFRRYGGSKWPNGEIPYYIGRGEFSKSQENFIMDSWNSMNNSVGKINIRPWKSGDEDYVYVISGRGCYAYMGRIGGSQTLSLQRNGCLSRGTIQHEMEHCLGMAHEQNRADRDNYLDVLWPNIPEDWHSQYEKTDERDYRLLGSYDCCSAMHYGMRAPGTGKDAFAMKTKAKCDCMGQRNGITASDIQKLNELYS